MEQTLQGFLLSPQQTRVWLLQQRDPLPYRAVCVLRLDGPLDRAALEAALRRSVARHEILRTRFSCLAGMTVPVQVVDVDDGVARGGHAGGAILTVEPDASLEALYERARRRPFDAEATSLLSATLAMCAGEHVLVLALPALASDRRGLDNLVREITRGYESCAAGRDDGEPPLQYPDYSGIVNDFLQSAEAGSGRAYWRQQASTAPRPAALSGAISVPADAAFAPEFEPVATTLPDTAALARRARALGVTEAALLLACWSAFLSRRTGAEARVGVEDDGRGYPELQETLGLMARHLPVCLEPCADESIGARALRVQQMLAEHRDWQESYEPEADAESYFAWCFEYVEEGGEERAGGVTFRLERRAVCIERFDVKLSCVRRGDELRAEWHYDGARHGRGEVERLSEGWLALLGEALEQPQRRVSELTVLGASERRQVLEVWSREAREYDREELVPRRIAAWARRAAGAPAVACGGVSLSYGELNERANRVAGRLRGLGVGAEARVALVVPRSVDMVVGVLGVLKSGAAYVPLDPGYPSERLAYMLSDSGACCVLSVRSLAGQLRPLWGEVLCLDDESEWVGHGGEECGVSLAPQQLAYVIYTSGSTGRPKGVGVEQRQLQNYVSAIGERLGLGEGQRFGLVSTLAADLGYTMLFPGLCSGGCVEVVEEDRAADGSALGELFGARPVDYLKIVPSHLRALLSAAGAERIVPRRSLVLGGEACRVELVEQVKGLSPECVVMNHYGPTETTVGVLSGELEAGVLPSLGRPLGNAEVYLLDGQMSPVPVGVSGEIYIGGAGVARGYVGRAELTAERFVPHPYASSGGQRLYRSGDLGRWREDGWVEFLGRADDQVKLRGYRVELGEIESALRAQAGVREAVVVAREEGDGERRLVAYVTAQEGEEAEPGSRPRYRLPNGMRVLHQNRAETDYQYREIFEEQHYLRQGGRLGDDGCVFDVGANIGMFALFASRCCRAGRVYAFEPIEELGEALRANVSRYGSNVRVYGYGLGREESRAEFTYYPRNSMFSGLRAYASGESERELVRSFLEPLLEQQGGEGGEDLHSLRAQADAIVAAQLESRVEVCRLRALSDVVREEGVERIDLLKIDVQGAEADVLRGIAPEHWGRIRQIVLEVHEEGAEGHRLEEIRGLLEEHGYRVDVSQAQRLQAGHRYDLYAVRPEEQERLRAWGRTAGMSLEPVEGEGAELSVGELMSLLGARLPAYMVPSAIVVLARLPLTANGKVDRQALPAPELALEPGGRRRLNPLEEVIAGIWSEVLHLPELVGAEQNFFELGGHSLLATQVTSRLRAALGMEVPVAWVFDVPTVAGLAARIEERRRAQRGLQAPPLVPVSRARPLPLSFAQQRLWFLDQWNPQSAFYNVNTCVRLAGDLDVAAVARTLNLLVQRHETLRTVFPAEDGRPMQVILPELGVELPVHDLRGLPESERHEAALRLVTEEARKPFDLARGPLLRAALLKLADRSHVLVIGVHHIVSDGWSNAIFLAELIALYESCRRGLGSPLPPLDVQYADYACWQRAWLQGEVIDEQLHYWRTQLDAAPPSLELRTDFPRPPVQSFRGRRQALELEAELTSGVRVLCRRGGVTLFMGLLAVFKVLLRHFTDQERIVVGTNSANRDRLEVERLIGFFVNQLVLLTDLSGDPPFLELLARVRQVVLGAFAHQELPFEQVVAELRPERNASHSPLYQVLFTLQAEQAPLSAPSGLEVDDFPIADETAKFELVLTMVDRGATLIASLEYNVDLFAEATVARMLEHFRSLLRAVVAHPERRLGALLEGLARSEAEARAAQLAAFASADRERLGSLRRGRGARPTPDAPAPEAGAPTPAVGRS